MTGILKVDQWKDSGDNALMTSDGAGNLTANTDINLGGSIIKNGNLIADVSGNIRLDADDAGEIRLLDGGTQYAALKNDSSRLKIQGIIQDQDILVVGNDGGVETTALSFDMSEGGRAIFYGGVALGGTGAANTLDDYEEGTWTPTISGSSVTNVGASSYNKYTKVGDTVFITGYIEFSSTPTENAAITIGGLPFTCNLNAGSGNYIAKYFTSIPASIYVPTPVSYFEFYGNTQTGNWRQIKYNDMNGASAFHYSFHYKTNS